MLELILKRWILTSILICIGAAPVARAFQFPPAPRRKDRTSGSRGIGNGRTGWMRRQSGWKSPEASANRGLRSNSCKPEHRICWSAQNHRAKISSVLAGLLRQLTPCWKQVIEWYGCARWNVTPQEQDFWGAGFMLPGCYFRVRQAEFFASLSGEKNSEQYVTWSKSFYQQARVAFDAHEYQRARLYGDASSFIVFALECIAQANVQMPDASNTK